MEVSDLWMYPSGRLRAWMNAHRVGPKKGLAGNRDRAATIGGMDRWSGAPRRRHPRKGPEIRAATVPGLRRRRKVRNVSRKSGMNRKRMLPESICPIIGTGKISLPCLTKPKPWTVPTSGGEGAKPEKDDKHVKCGSCGKFTRRFRFLNIKKDLRIKNPSGPWDPPLKGGS